MRFQIPQFIDIEDKIFGPFTLKQFLYLAGGASTTLMATTFFGFFVGIVITSPIIVLSLALAFYKINNRPFISVIEAGFKYIIGSKLYIWKKTEKTTENSEKENKYTTLVVPNLSKSRLKDMNWALDVKKNEEQIDVDN